MRHYVVTALLVMADEDEVCAEGTDLGNELLEHVCDGSEVLHLVTCEATVETLCVVPQIIIEHCLGSVHDDCLVTFQILDGVLNVLPT